MFILALCLNCVERLALRPGPGSVRSYKLAKHLCENIFCEQIPNLKILIILNVLTIRATFRSLKYWAVLLTSPKDATWNYHFLLKLQKHTKKGVRIVGEIRTSNKDKNWLDESKITRMDKSRSTPEPASSIPATSTSSVPTVEMASSVTPW